MIKKILKWAGITLAVALVVSQFIRRAKTNPPVDEASTLSARLQVTPEVEATLNRSCINCYSHKTASPSHRQIAAGWWTLTYDVNEGCRQWCVSNATPEVNRSSRR